MLRQVSRQDEHEPVKTVVIGDLSMSTQYIAVDDNYQAIITKYAHSAPKCRFATPYLVTHGRLFRVDITVICPIPEQLKCDVTLCRRQIKELLEAIPDEIIFLEKQAAG